MQNKLIEQKLKKTVEQIKKLPAFKFIPKLVKKYPQVGIYAVGGYVRDAIMDRRAKDVDIVINRINFSDLVDLLLEYGKVIFDLEPKTDLAKLNSKKRQELLSKGFGVIKFIPRDKKDSIDIALPRVDIHEKSEVLVDGIKRDVLAQANPAMKIEDDLGRRDFTVNAIALDLRSGEMIDTYEGVGDILNKKLKAIGKPEQRILKEDLSRAFRGLRFVVQLGFEIDIETQKAIKKAFQPTAKNTREIYEKEDKTVLEKLISKEKQIRDEFLIELKYKLPKVLQVFYDKRVGVAKTAVAVEIITEEFCKSFEIDPLETLKIWEEYGVLKIILPEVLAMRSVVQPIQYHSEGDVYQHTFLALKSALTKEKKVGLNLKLAILLHDIGKVATIKFDLKDSNGINFYKHDQVGAEMAKKIFARLNFSKQISEPVVWAIKNHMLAINALKNNLKDSTLEKYFFDDEIKGDLLLKLIKYDAMASIPASAKESNLESYQYLAGRIKNLAKLKDKNNKLPLPLINGDDLIALGLKPNAKFSEILDKIRNAQLKGEVKTKKEAIEMVKSLK
ncbi:MAG: HDIG domain-containing metalloprotein [Patescibacteria group bacterium]